MGLYIHAHIAYGYNQWMHGPDDGVLTDDEWEQRWEIARCRVEDYSDLESYLDGEDTWSDEDYDHLEKRMKKLGVEMTQFGWYENGCMVFIIKDSHINTDAGGDLLDPTMLVAKPEWEAALREITAVLGLNMGTTAPSWFVQPSAG
jgi:hypothetical protein